MCCIEDSAKVLKTMSRYFTHDNGGRPFKVVLAHQMLAIYTKESLTYNRLMLGPIPYVTAFIGQDRNYVRSNGNSILVKVGDKRYMYIGKDVYTFETLDEIIDYKSPIGPNDVPYPYAIGTDFTYLMIEDVYMPNNLYGDYEPYRFYYGFHLPNDTEHTANIKAQYPMLGKEELIARQW